MPTRFRAVTKQSLTFRAFVVDTSPMQVILNTAADFLRSTIGRLTVYALAFGALPVYALARLTINLTA